ELAVLESSVAPDDSDADGLSDAWETAHFGGAGEPDGGAGDDFDGDGLLNIEEYIAGTDPASGTSVFAVDLSMSGRAVRVSFVAVEATGPGYSGLSRYYALETSAALGGAVSWLGVPGYTDVAGHGQTVVYTNVAPGAAGAYRGRVWLE
ncbi:MAG: hypothetical protein JXR37_25670, partial [Kiritimatiellae bacterium]|nr:hypothetical protein [Kiritimatiellia bacterium]